MQKPKYYDKESLEIKIGELEIEGLMDMRSNAKCIQLERMEQNKLKIGKIEELPITGINIIIATGKKSWRINKIIHYGLKLSILNMMQGLVVLNIVQKLIIGTSLCL